MNLSFRRRDTDWTAACRAHTETRWNDLICCPSSRSAWDVPLTAAAAELWWPGATSQRCIFKAVLAVGRIRRQPRDARLASDHLGSDHTGRNATCTSHGSFSNFLTVRPNWCLLLRPGSKCEFKKRKRKKKKTNINETSNYCHFFLTWIVYKFYW